MRTLCTVSVLFAAVMPVSAQVARFDTIEKAVEAAQKDKKDILLDFTGSDWCDWCIKLNQEVFDLEAWTKGAADKYVFVELDFPRRKAIAEEQKKYNQRLKELHGVQEFPTILVLDSEGRVYARTGYQAGGPEAFLKHLAEFASRKEILAAGLKDAAGRKLTGVVALLGKLEQWEVEASYLHLNDLAIELDAGNKDGVRLKFGKRLALAGHHGGKPEQYAKYLKIVKEVSAEAGAAIETEVWIRKDLQPMFEKANWKGAYELLNAKLTMKGEAGQQVHYFAAMCLLRLGDKAKCIELLKKAIELAPGTEGAERSKGEIEALEKK